MKQYDYIHFEIWNTWQQNGHLLALLNIFNSSKFHIKNLIGIYNHFIFYYQIYIFPMGGSFSNITNLLESIQFQTHCEIYDYVLVLHIYLSLWHLYNKFYNILLGMMVVFIKVAPCQKCSQFSL
jgi:hypothetical protein